MPDPKLEFTAYQHEMMEGLIFSDAHIVGGPSFSFRFEQTTKRLEYIEFVKKEFKFNTTITYIKHPPNGSYVITKGNGVFGNYRNRWYPEDKKIIPKDFKLTPISCTHLYLGDGHYNMQGNISICTHGFLKENVEEVFLPQLHKLDIECHMVKDMNFWRVYIPGRCVNTFLEYIGPAPIKCFPQKYEWGL